jgi:hypothetical protein
MHTEHLQNIKPGVLLTGWIIALGVTSLIVLVFEASDIATFGPANALASLIAVVLGFLAGGFFTGFVARQAPSLHGIGVGLTSIVAWVIVNAFAALMGWPFESGGLSAGAAVGLILAQIIAAIIGALLGYNIAVRGKPGLSEDLS